MSDEAVAEAPEAEVAEVETDAAEVEEFAEGEESGEAEAKADGEPSESSTEKKDDGFQKRIDELTRRHYQSQAELQAERQRAEELAKRLESLQPKAEPGKRLADFDYDEDKYAAYLSELAQGDAQTQAQQRIQQEQHRQAVSRFQEREAQFASTVDDYQRVAHYAPISEQVADILISAEKGPELAYYLGKHPETAVALSSMAPYDAAREIGRIEALELGKKPPVSKTPPPVPKIKPKDVKTDKSLTDPMSQAEFEARRRKIIAKR